jgi:hypothetical protein
MPTAVRAGSLGLQPAGTRCTYPILVVRCFVQHAEAASCTVRAEPTIAVHRIMGTHTHKCRHPLIFCTTVWHHPWVSVHPLASATSLEFQMAPAENYGIKCAFHDLETSFRLPCGDYRAETIHPQHAINGKSMWSPQGSISLK